jgi:hypothetical protein
MTLKFCAAGLCAAVLAAAAMTITPAVSTAEAAQKKRVVSQGKKRVVTTQPRARVRVQPRSFLDAGTDVLPGERKFTDYALPPGYSPTSVIDNTAFSHRSPLPGPFDLPGRDNPYPWNWCVGC